VRRVGLRTRRAAEAEHVAFALARLIRSIH
jgi:hypothetical protein